MSPSTVFIHRNSHKRKEMPKKCINRTFLGSPESSSGNPVLETNSSTDSSAWKVAGFDPCNEEGLIVAGHAVVPLAHLEVLAGLIRL